MCWNPDLRAHLELGKSNWYSDGEIWAAAAEYWMRCDVDKNIQVTAWLSFSTWHPAAFQPYSLLIAYARRDLQQNRFHIARAIHEELNGCALHCFTKGESDLGLHVRTTVRPAMRVCDYTLMSFQAAGKPFGIRRTNW